MCFTRQVKVTHFLCVHGGTEQQCHSFKDYTHGRVSGVVKGQISNLSAHFLALKSLTAKMPFAHPTRRTSTSHCNTSHCQPFPTLPSAFSTVKASNQDVGRILQHKISLLLWTLFSYFLREGFHLCIRSATFLGP